MKILKEITRNWTWKDWLAAPLAFVVVMIGFLLHWLLPQLLGFKNGWERK